MPLHWMAIPPFILLLVIILYVFGSIIFNFGSLKFAPYLSIFMFKDIDGYCVPNARYTFPSITHLVMVFAAVIVHDHIMSHMMGLKVASGGHFNQSEKEKNWIIHAVISRLNGEVI